MLNFPLRITFILIGLFALNAQNNGLYHKILNKTDGLEIEKVKALQFDDQGFLWIGGSSLDNRVIISNENRNILQRYNGFSFENIPLPKTKKPIVSVNHFYKRKDGLFYVLLYFDPGLAYYVFNPITSEFKELLIEDSLLKIGYSKIFEFKDETFLLSQTDRLVSFLKLNDDGSTVKLFDFTSNENKFLIESSTKILPFDNFILVSDDNFQTMYFDWKGNILNIEKHKQKSWIDEVFSFNNRKIAFTNDNGYLKIVDETKITLKPINNINNVKSTHLATLNDKNGNHYILAFYENQLNFNKYNGDSISSKYNVSIINCNGIEAISENLEEDLWLATAGNLHYFNFPKRVIKNYLEDIEIRALHSKNDSLFFVATENKGWYQLNVKNDTFNKLYSKQTNTNLNFYSSVNIIDNDSVIWTNDGPNITELNTSTLEFKNYKHYPIISLEQLNDSLLVYGTNRYNLMSFNKHTKTHKPIFSTDTLYIYDIAVKNNNDIVCATDKGIIHYNFISKSKTFYGSKFLEDPFLLMVDYSKDYGFLCGSRSGIIYRFNEQNSTFKTIFKDDLKAGIATILPFENNLWINTFNGYINYNTKNGKTERYSEKDGFSNNEANRYSAIKKENDFFVGSLKGLNVFDPNRLKTQITEAQLITTKVTLFNNETSTFNTILNQEYLKELNKIQLPAENRRLNISFALKNNFARENSYSFMYRLDKRDWIDLKQQNTIVFPNLASGSYNLEIKAVNFSGNPVGDSLFIKIKSNDFFYKTWWFITAVSLLIIGVLLYFLRQFELRKRLQDQFASDLIMSQESERKRIARELHDSVSQQLTLIKRKAQNDNNIEISELTNSTLEEVRHISRGLFPPLLKQLGLTESIEQLAADIDEANSIFISTNITNIDSHLNEAQSLHFYRFIQECLNNILKHAQAKAVALTIKKQNNNILLTIKDNGKGFEINLAKNKNSLGLKTLEERIKILNGDFLIESKNGQGTTIKAKIPF